MAIELNGTTGITTPDITSEAGLTVDGVSFASGAPANTLVTTSGGNVGIGTSSPSEKLHVTGNVLQTWESSHNRFVGTQYSTTYENGLRFLEASRETQVIAKAADTGGLITFFTGTAPTERARIDSSGNLLVGTTSINSNFRVHLRTPSGNGGIIMAPNTDTYSAIRFLNAALSAQIGEISCTASSTAYNTSSDYRLKENVVGVTGASARVQQLNPVRFNFIVDPDTTVDGFLAHEVQDVVPEAITGAKDAVDAEGNPVYQGIDQSKLVPLLTAALQEALTKIETLEARVAALEAA